MQASQGLQVSTLRTPRGKPLAAYGNEKVSKPPLRRRLRGKNVREMLFHPVLVCFSGVQRIPKQKLSVHHTNPRSAPGRAGGDTGGPRGCAALAALRGAARNCPAFLAPLVLHPVSDHGSSVPCFSSAAAGLRPARESRTAVPAPAGDRQRQFPVGQIPPEEGAVVTNFPKLSSGPTSPLSVRGWGRSEEKQTK